jgi:hypothetical protein
VQEDGRWWGFGRGRCGLDGECIQIMLRF